jgi:hypothetical protein
MWYLILIVFIIFQGIIIYKQRKIIEQNNALKDLAGQCYELAEIFRPKENALPLKIPGDYKIDKNGNFIESNSDD